VFYDQNVCTWQTKWVERPSKISESKTDVVYIGLMMLSSISKYKTTFTGKSVTIMWSGVWSSEVVSNTDGGDLSVFMATNLEL